MLKVIECYVRGGKKEWDNMDQGCQGQEGVGDRTGWGSNERAWLSSWRSWDEGKVSKEKCKPEKSPKAK